MTPSNNGVYSPYQLPASAFTGCLFFTGLVVGIAATLAALSAFGVLRLLGVIL